MLHPSEDAVSCTVPSGEGRGTAGRAQGSCSPTSMTLCLAVGCRECQCLQKRNCSTGTLSLSNTTITTLCKCSGHVTGSEGPGARLSPRAWQVSPLQQRLTSAPSPTCPTHLDFAGGQSEAFTSRWGAQGDGVELTLVEVGHGRLARFDVNGFGGTQGVLKVTVESRRVVRQAPGRGVLGA